MVSTATTASAVPAPVSARLIAAQTATTAPLWATEPPTAPAAASGGELTERERVVLVALGRGSTLREIATREFVSYNTVKTHVRNIYRKLGIDDRASARRAARSLGLL